MAKALGTTTKGKHQKIPRQCIFPTEILLGLPKLRPDFGFGFSTRYIRKDEKEQGGLVSGVLEAPTA